MAMPDSLTLSSATFAKLSPHPYLLANLQPPPPTDASSPTPVSARTNGRQPQQARQPNINTSSLSHAHGSAVVRTGDTTVICGVRGETLRTSQIPNYRNRDFGAGGMTEGDEEDEDEDAGAEELREYDLLVPNIELATGCAPDFLPGVPPTSLAQTLSTRVYSLLHGSRLLNAADLRIYQKEGTAPAEETQGEAEAASELGPATDLAQEVKAYWVLYIDLLFISYDGNPFDAAWAAVLAALRDTRLPRAHWDPDRETVLCARPDAADSAATAPRPLRLRGLPIACTAAVFTASRGRQRHQKSKNKQGGDDGSDAFWVLVDPDRFEEGLCDESVTVVVDRSEGRRSGESGAAETKVLSITKSGGTVVGPQVLRRLVPVAEERWQVFRDALG